MSSVADATSPDLRAELTGSEIVLKALVDQAPKRLAGGPALGLALGHEGLFGRIGDPDFERLALLHRSGFGHLRSAGLRPVAARPGAKPIWRAQAREIVSGQRYRARVLTKSCIARASRRPDWR